MGSVPHSLCQTVPGARYSCGLSSHKVFSEVGKWTLKSDNKRLQVVVNILQEKNKVYERGQTLNPVFLLSCFVRTKSSHFLFATQSII